MSHPIGEYFNIVRQIASQNNSSGSANNINQSTSVNYTPATNYTPGPVDANRAISGYIVSNSSLGSITNQISSSSPSSSGSSSSRSLSSSSDSGSSYSSNSLSYSSSSHYDHSSSAPSSVSHSSSGSYSSHSSISSSRSFSSSVSSSSDSSGSQYSFSSRELHGNKEFWNVYNNYAIKAVDERIKNDPDFRKELAESGDYAFARSQTILLTAIYKYKTGEDGVVLAPKERRGSYLSDQEIGALISKEKEDKEKENILVGSNSLDQKERSSVLDRVKKITDSALAARRVFSQVAIPIASNTDGSVKYLIGDQSVNVKDVKTQYVGMNDGSYIYKQTLKADDGKQYIVEAKLDSNLEKAEYRVIENKSLTSSNIFDLSSLYYTPNYTPYSPAMDAYEKRKDVLSPPEQFERAAKDGFKKLGISDVPVVGDAFNFGTEVFSRGVLGAAFELVNPSGNVGEQAKAIGQSGAGFVVSLPFRAAAGSANLLLIHPLEFFKEYGKSGGEKISKGDYFGGAFDLALGTAVAGLTVVPFTKGAVKALKGSGSNIVKREAIENTAESKAIDRLNQRVYGSDYVYIKTGSIENNAVRGVASNEVKQKSGGILSKIDIPGSVGLSVATDPLVYSTASNAVRGVIPAFVPAVAVGRNAMASSFMSKTVSSPKYRFFSYGEGSQKDASFERKNNQNDFFVANHYVNRGLTIKDVKNTGLLVVKEKRNISEVSVAKNENTLMVREGFDKEKWVPWPFEKSEIKIELPYKEKSSNKNKNENEYPGVKDESIIIRKEKNENKYREENRFKFGGKYKGGYKEGNIFGRGYKKENTFGFKDQYINRESYTNKTENMFENEYLSRYREQYTPGSKTKNKSNHGKVKIPIPNISLPNFNFLERKGRKKSVALGFSKLDLIV